METRNIALLFTVAAVVAISLFAAGCAQAPPPANQPSPGSLPGQTGTGQQTAQAGSATGYGQVVYTLSDVAPDMGAVQRIDITVDSVIMHSSGSNWTTVSSTPKTYDLIALKASGAQSLLADANLAPGTYDQMRLGISSVMVTDSNGTHSAKLPSGVLAIKGQFSVIANSTTLINLDFLADKSLHVTGNGQYILAPVIHLVEKNNAKVDSGNRMDVIVRGGRMHTDIEVGMDENGERGPSEELEVSEMRERMQLSMQKLPPLQRQVIDLFYDKGINQKTIASTLKLSRPKVCRLIDRGIRQLQQDLTHV